MMKYKMKNWIKLKISKNIRIRNTPRSLVKKQLMVLGISLVLAVLTFLASMSESALIHGTRLPRGSYGSPGQSFPLIVNGLPEEDPLSVEVSVSSKKYTMAEANQVFAEIYQKIESLIVSEGDSLAALSEDLKLPTTLPQYGVRLSWDYYPESLTEDKKDQTYYRTWRNLIDHDGTVYNQDLAEGTVITGYLSLVMSTEIDPTESPEYADRRYKSEPYQIYVNVVPRTYTRKQRMVRNLKKLLQEQDLKNPASDYYELPSEIDGHTLSFHDPLKLDWLLFPCLGVLAAALLWFRQGQQQKEEKKKRETSLLLDYSELVSKLMVYSGAGFTLRNAFLQINRHYQALIREKIVENRPLFQELQILDTELSRNVPESDAYLAFARRVNLKPYTRLVSILEQNRRNGGQALRQQLNLEMEDAFETRKSTALRLGEEAGTKLLLPLFMMLAIVMMIVIVPAMISFT